MLSFSPRRDSGPGGRVHSATTLRTGGKAWHSFLFYGSKGESSTLLLSFPDQYGFCSILISVRIDAKVTKISKKPYLCTPKNFKLREDEENKCSCDGENKYPIDEKNKYPIDEENKYPIDEENDLSTDEENNLPCYPVDIAFACFLQVEKEYGG